MSSRRTQLQLLWDLADATFGGNQPPNPQQLEALRHAISLVPLTELGIAPPSPPPLAPLTAPGTPQSATSPPTTTTAATTTKDITYQHIYEDSKFSLGIFCLPANAQIPLHNHPGMTVFSRVLYGTMHVTSYDWRDPSCPEEGVVLVHDRPFTAGDAPSSLFPCAGGNLHQFTAVTDCAVLDLLSPPYSTDQGRDCTYYRPVEAQNGAVVLEEYEPPEDFVITSVQYVGVPISPTASGASSPTSPLSSGDFTLSASAIPTATTVAAAAAAGPTISADGEAVGELHYHGTTTTTTTATSSVAWSSPTGSGSPRSVTPPPPGDLTVETEREMTRKLHLGTPGPAPSATTM